jgi:hypothetical protein
MLKFWWGGLTQTFLLIGISSLIFWELVHLCLRSDNRKAEDKKLKLSHQADEASTYSCMQK